MNGSRRLRKGTGVQLMPAAAHPPIPKKPRIGQESVRSPLSMTLLSCPIKQFVSCQPTAMPTIPHYSGQL